MRGARVVISMFVLLTLVYSAFQMPLSSSVEAQEFGEIPYIEYDECPILIPDTEIEGETLECGYLLTLEDPFDPDSAIIEIAFAILKSTSPNPAPDPIVYLDGGPGGSGLLTIDWWVESPLREERDMILVDQRGTGFSLPALNCVEYEEYDEESASDDYDPMADCLERLEDEGVDVANYHTVNSATDIADLIEVLDVGKANLLGISYGTRLALAVMRDHPKVVRSAILDSTYPQAVNGYEEEATNAQRAFDKLFEHCAASPACNGAYPDLAEVFYEVVNELDEFPAPVLDEEDEEYDLTGEELVTMMFYALYDSTLIPALPAAIYYAAEEDYQSAVDLITYGRPDIESEEVDYYMSYSEDELDNYYADFDSLGDTEGAFYALECQEEIAYNDLDRAYAQAETLRPEIADALLIDVEDTFTTCELWNVETAPAIENEQVVSDLPTLVVAGDLDPITPPAWGQLAVSTLSRGYYFEFPGLGHGVTDSDECPQLIMAQFLDNPDAAPDGTCIADMAGPDFYIR